MSKVYTALALSAVCSRGARGRAQMSADEITKEYEAAGSDPAKVKAYCAMTKKMDEVGDDQKKAEAAGDEIDGYFKTLGSTSSLPWMRVRMPPTGARRRATRSMTVQ